MPPIADLATFACRLADAARAETMSRWREAGRAENKDAGGGYDPVTQADVAAERAMRAIIVETYPEHGIAGEELDDRPSTSGLVWSLDPIDGTRSFVCGLPTWVTLIALLRDGEPVIGLIDAPRLDERYLGFGGSTRQLPGEGLLRTSGCRDIADARLSSTDPGLFAGGQSEAFDRLCARCRVVRYGHDGYAYARLAAGSIDVVVEAGLKPYDLMALIPVVQGAGGVVGNWDGGSDVSDGRVVAAATTELYEQAVALLA